MNRGGLTKATTAISVTVLVGAALVAGASPASGDRSRASNPRPATRVDRADLAARGRWVHGELVVQFEEGASRAQELEIHDREGGEVEDRLSTFDADAVELAPEVSVAEAVDGYEDHPLVERAEPNTLIYSSLTPNDPRFPRLWGLSNTGQTHPLADDPDGTGSGKSDSDIDAPEAWDTQTGSPNVVIGVLDSGVDVDHPDLDSSLWMNDDPPGDFDNDGDPDDDGNGLVDDTHGWDFAQGRRRLLNRNSGIFGYDHGTHVAGTIGAEMNNNTGVAGVCPGCKIMVLKFMKPVDTDGDGSRDTMAGTLAAELAALEYAIDEGAAIINGSFSSFLWSAVERAAYARVGRADILSVFAAGNSALDNDLLLDSPLGFSPEYPASYTLGKILSVAASNHVDHYGYDTACARSQPKWVCAFSSWGHDSVDLAAPGVDVLSTVPEGRYKTLSGTSMAAPHVAGIAGLVESQNPDYGASEIKNAIMNGVDQPNGLTKLHIRGGPETGSFSRTDGRANANVALTAPTTDATPQTDGNVNGAQAIRRFKRGRVAWPHDVNDVYRKRLIKGRQYKAVFDGPRGSDLDLAIWKPGTKEIWQLERGCNPGQPGPCKLLRYANTPGRSDATVRFRAPMNGVHYFQVSAWLQNAGRYTLRVRRD